MLAHGWAEQLSFWGPVIKLLAARGMRVVAYDLRGHGRSGPAVEHDYAPERFGEDVEAVLAAAGGEVVREDGRATVVGHSLGAMSIAAWAQRHDVSTHAHAAALVNTGLVTWSRATCCSESWRNGSTTQSPAASSSGRAPASRPSPPRSSKP